MYTQTIIIDFEMNPVAKKNKAVRKYLNREIIEVGAVKLNSENEIIGTFGCYVRPEYNKSITPFINKLTGISTADVENADTLKKVLGTLENWIGYSNCTKIYCWSNSDLIQLQAECTYKQICIPRNMCNWIDFQKEYFELMEINESHNVLALHSAAEQFGMVMDQKLSHSALYDAEITANLLIPFLTGVYREQAELLRNSMSTEIKHESYSLGEACGAVLQQFYLQTQPALGMVK